MLDSLVLSLFASQGDAIIAVDRDGIIRCWNPGARRIFGFAEEEAVGQTLDLIVPEALRERHNSGFARVMAGGGTRYGAGDLLAVPALTKDGRRISVEFTIVLVRDARGEARGQVEGLAAIMRDVTPRFEETRALRRKIAALEARSSGETAKS
jgi:PAS domain S-box-containing protein